MNQRTSGPFTGLVLILGVLWGCGHGEAPPATAANAPSPAEPAAAANAPASPSQPTTASTEAPSDQRVGATMRQPTSETPAAADESAPHPHVDPSAMTAGPQTSGPVMPAPVDLTALDDAQLGGMVAALDDAEIAHMQLALSRALSIEVRRFAGESLAVHRNGATQDAEAFAQLKMTPTVSAISKSVHEDWEHDAASLRGTPATEFDRTFIEHQIGLDNKALTLIDSALVTVKSQPLKGQLRRDRMYLAGRLQEAETLQKALRERTQ